MIILFPFHHVQYKPAIFNSFRESLEKVARNIENLELRQTTYGVWEKLKLIGVHIKHQHVE